MKSVEQYNFFQEVTTFTTKGQFSDWIWRTLNAQYSPSTTGRQDEFRKFLIDTEQEAIVTGLEAIYDKLEKDVQQPLFRQSIGDVLASHGNAENTPPEVCEDLIYLTAKVRAVESLDALVPTIGNGLLGQKHPDSWFSAIGVLKLLAPAPEVKQAMSKLIDGANFDNGYILEAVGILVKCDPTQTPVLLSNFAPRLADLREKTKALGGDEWKAYLEGTDDLTNTIRKYSPAVKLALIKKHFLEIILVPVEILQLPKLQS